jgi:predicted small secreted protein
MPFFRRESRNRSAKGDAMFKRTTMLILTLLALLGAPLLGACHTMSGAGEDISKTGQAIEKSADKNTPR